MLPHKRTRNGDASISGDERPDSHAIEDLIDNANQRPKLDPKTAQDWNIEVSRAFMGYPIPLQSFEVQMEIQENLDKLRRRRYMRDYMRERRKNGKK